MHARPRDLDILQWIARTAPVVWVTLAAPSGGFAECVDYSRHIRLVSNLRCGDVTAIHADDAFVYVATAGTPDRLLVVDAADPVSPKIVGTADVEGYSVAIDVSGDLVCLAGALAGLLVVDVSDPTAPVVRGQIDTPSAAADVAVVGTTAHVADASYFGLPASLIIVDLANPDLPTTIGTLPLARSCSAVSIADGVAYLAGGDAYFVDVSDPAQPTLLASLSAPLGASDVAVLGAHAYFVGESELMVVDINDPGDPEVVGGTTVPYRVGNRLDAVDETLYVAGSGLHVLDVAEPSTPRLQGAYSPRPLLGVAAGKNVYIAAGTSGLLGLEPGDKDTPKVIHVDTPGDASAVALLDRTAFVADADGGLQIVDVTDGDAPVIVGMESLGGSWAKDVAISGSDLFVACLIDGLTILDATSPWTPQFVGSVAWSDAAVHVAVSGRYAYVTAPDSYPHGGVPVGSYLYIIDAADRTAPQLVGHVLFPQEWASLPGEVAVRGDRAYVAAGTIGFFVVDVSVPGTPAIVGSLGLPVPTGVVLDGPFAYVADRTGSLFVLDITEPALPRTVAELTFPDAPNQLLLANGIAYVASASTIYAVDIADPRHPARVGQVPLSPNANVVTLASMGARLLVADGTSGLGVVPMLCGVPTGTPIVAAPRTQPLAIYPNPTRGRVRIDVPNGQVRRATLHDVTGRLVRVLRDQWSEASPSVEWDGTDQRGRPVAAGSYLVRVVDARGVSSGRVAVIR